MSFYEKLSSVITEQLKQHGALGFYLVILQPDGNTHSEMACHPMIPRRHLYEHVVPTLADDMTQDGLTLSELVQGFMKRGNLK